jgi:poly-gamma-glutamate capsule biosynthesis protein CapA/YwtB (metallophosphatase superfamily)
VTAPFNLLMVGDIVLDEPDPDSFFDPSRAILRGADVLVGHVETPYTTRGRELQSDVPAEAADPAKIAALGRAGFRIATLAGNHVFDRGAEGIEDTVAALRGQDIVSCGAGPTLDEARRAAVVARAGRCVGVLSYNCVGPRDSWAGPAKAGCAYVHILTHYEAEGANPGGPPKVYTFAEPSTVEAMQADVERLRGEVDLAVVAFHKGVVHTPAHIAMYERPLARAAVEAGADVVIGHHAHILRGVEVYRGKPIFHGLGNFVVVTRALNVEDNAHPARLAWAKRRREVFGFTPDPDYPTYPFHPEAKNAMIAACTVAADGTVSPGFLPCWIRPDGAPEVLGRSDKGQAVLDYVIGISRAAGLTTDFAWDGDRVVFG